MHQSSDGSITALGEPEGEYTEATWHLEGVYDGEPFNCDPEIFTNDFNPVISGEATDSEMVVSVDLPNAIEANDEEDCGGGFLAFAASLQKLRESLNRCGAMHLPYAASHTDSCSKWKNTRTDISSPVTGTSNRTIEDAWDLRLTRTGAGPTPTSTATSTTTSSASPTGPTPSPSASNPSPSPSPSPTPSTHGRKVLVVLRKHLRATGAVVLIGWGAPECVDSVPVRIQRRVERASRTVWKTEKSITTSAVGIFSTKVTDKSGKYRAVAPKITKGQATFNAATSKTKKHKH